MAPGCVREKEDRGSVYEPIMKNALKIQFQMLKNSKNKFSM
jgi:hypothetical protein